MADKETSLVTAFVGGEISPYMQGRVDVAKVRMGANTCRNWFIDYRGGVLTRPGAKFVGIISMPDHHE
jgi:hypothetical protein